MGNAVTECQPPVLKRRIVRLSHCELETMLDVKRCVDGDGEEA